MSLEKYFIQEGIIRSEVENYLRNELSRAGYSGIDIQKTSLVTRVILYVEKPPLVIGKKGKRINTLTDYLKTKYHIENPIIDVQKIENPTLDPNIVARRIAVALERGINRRRVAYKALRAVMGSGARGIEIVLSGKIVGKGGRSRVEKYLEGYMKKCGESSKLVKVGMVQAALKAGVIGVTVKIVPPNTIFPDQISVKKPEPVVEAAAKETAKSEKDGGAKKRHARAKADAGPSEEGEEKKHKKASKTKKADAAVENAAAIEAEAPVDSSKSEFMVV